jgi:hypothetical protein
MPWILRFLGHRAPQAMIDTVSRLGFIYRIPILSFSIVMFPYVILLLGIFGIFRFKHANFDNNRYGILTFSMAWFTFLYRPKKALDVIFLILCECE